MYPARAEEIKRAASTSVNVSVLLLFAPLHTHSPSPLHLLGAWRIAARDSFKASFCFSNARRRCALRGVSLERSARVVPPSLSAEAI